MAKTPATSYICSQCGWVSIKWVGRCSQCGEWGTLEERTPPEAGPGAANPTRALTPSLPATPITSVPTTAARKSPTGVAEFDRVLGGGLVPGAVLLLAGEPGIGKSTLLLDVAARAARTAQEEGKGPVLYVSGEESASQVRLRGERIGAMNPHLHLAAESNLARVLGHISAEQPSLVVVDSVQTISDPDTDGTPGGSAQVKAVTSALVNIAKTHELPVLLVGHVTKDGAIAGPRVLEHLVDVVCQFDGDRHSRLRMVRAVKNRYGATDEVGCFELTDTGIIGLPDPSGLFLSSRTTSVPGTCATITLEGRRPMPVEVQGLVVPSSGRPQRTMAGVSFSRASITIAVLQARAGMALDQKDVFVSTVGGAQANEPASDIAIALSLASAYSDLPIAPGAVAFGEVALTGELRPVSGLKQRLAEASRLGFTLAIVPANSEVKAPAGITLRRCADVRSAIQSVLPLG